MRHIGFIMDGNRRFAKKFSNIVRFGHEQGGKNIEKVLELCLREQIEYVSMWALSTENIRSRSSEEISAIYDLLRENIVDFLPKLRDNHIRFEYVGNRELLPTDIVALLDDAVRDTALGDKMTFILAIGYGGQDEILSAVRSCIASGLTPDDIDADSFLSYLDTGRFPPPDLIVRTGGDIRHSGYWLYQSAYSEYYFTETLWPDFDEADFRAAIDWYQTKSQRNFGR